MKNFNKTGLILLILSSIAIAGQPVVGSKFSYQGQLQDNGTPANGLYDMRFEIYSSFGGGIAQGTDDIDDVNVSNGLFNVALNFGDAVFNGEELYLRILVTEANFPGYFALSPRQRINAVPYAIQSEFVENSSSPWDDIAGGIGYTDDVKIGNIAVVSSSMLTVTSGAGQSPIRFIIANGDTKMIINSNGGTSIGANEATPVNGLYVEGESNFNNDVKIGNTNTVTSSMLTVDADPSQSPVRFKVGGSTKMILRSNGGTAIGNNTTPPANGLYVEGDANQALSSHGFVKAGVVIRCDSGFNGNSERYFNNVNGLDFTTAESGAAGFCQITVPFDISNAFYTVSGYQAGGVTPFNSANASCSERDSTTLRCQISHLSNVVANGDGVLQILFY